MNLIDLKKRVRSMTRDFSNSIFREEDVINYINESIDRLQQVIPEFSGISHLVSGSDEPTHIPKQYHHLLSVYSASRCFAQDERHYQATTYMNEFEVKMEELQNKIEAGDIKVIDPETGEEVTKVLTTDYVEDNYFSSDTYVDGIDDEGDGKEGY